MTVSALQRIGRAVEAVISQPAPPPHRTLAFFLGLLAAGYGGAMVLRRHLYKNRLLAVRRLACPVIAVGNITVGGTGKTPLAVALARRLSAQGVRPALISRGYRGRAEKSGGVVSDGNALLMGPGEAGDEPFMMACELSRVPVVVGADRFRAGCLALSSVDPDLVILDDAFQHLRLYRDIDLVVMDPASPFGNGRLLPRGPLREPVSSLGRADAVVLNRTYGANGQTGLPAGARGMAGPRPVFTAVTSLRVRQAAGAAGRKPAFAPVDVDALKGRRAMAFSGIARNHRFVAGLGRLGLDLAMHFSFPDHHWYTGADLARILRAAGRSGAGMVVTTEKDWVRVFGRVDWPLPVVVVGTEACFGDEGPALDRFIADRLAAAGKKGGG